MPSNKKNIDITPTANILHSLTRTGYHWSQALLDIIDNSVDTLRERYNQTGQTDGMIRIIPIGYESKEEKKKIKTKFVVIADNGMGIEPDLLKEILRLGESAKRGTTALGTFGMGLKTAAMSLGTTVSIVSTTSTIDNLKAITWDVEACLESGKFEASFNEKPSKYITEQFMEHVGGNVPGTIVVIGNLHEGTPTMNAIVKTIKAKCAHTYRHLLSKKDCLNYEFPFKIIAGRTAASPAVVDTNDPLCIDNELTTVLIGGDDGAFETHSYDDYEFGIRMVRFDSDGKRGTKSREARAGSGLGQYIQGTHRQGVYWLRQGREISCGSFWPTNPSLTNVYAEISFNDSGVAGQISPIRMDFGKKGIEVDDDLRDYLLKHVFGPQLEKIKKELAEKTKNKRLSDRSEIMKKVASTILPTDHFGRSKTPPKDRRIEAVEKLFNPSKKKKRTNSKYTGGGIEIGRNETQIEFEECSWPGSTLPFNLDYTVGDPVCKIQINIIDPWIEKNIYLCQEPEMIAKNLQLIGAMTVACMYESEETRTELYTKMGVLLSLFDDDFGRMASELEEYEIEAPIYTVEPTNIAEELEN